MRACVSLIFLFSFAGCYESHVREGGPIPPPIGVDGGVTPPPPGSRSFVLVELEVPEPIGGVAPGANLDGIDSGMGSFDPSADCQEFTPDYRAFYDPIEGVDSAFSGLVGTVNGFFMGETIDSRIRDTISSGMLLLGFTVRPAEGLMDVYMLDATGGFDFGADGRIAPGQTFQVREHLATGSLATAGARSMAVFAQLSVPVPTWVVPLLPLANLQNVQMRFDSTDAGLVRGEMGASVFVDDAVAASTIIAPGMEETVRSLLDNVADIAPSAANPQVCDSLSAGMLFEAVPATFTGL